MGGMTRALLLLAVTASAAPAGEERSAPVEEPAYASKRPLYALVTMGAQEARRFWIVVDGADAYVGRDGDGRIRTPGERTTLDGSGTHVSEIDGCDESGAAGRYRLRFSVEEDAKKRSCLKSVSVTRVDEIQDYRCTAGRIPLGERADLAPRIPIHGPLRFVLMDHWTGSTACRTLSRAGGPHEFSILVATPVQGIDVEAYVYPHLYRLQGEDLPRVAIAFESAGPAPVPPPALKTWMCECGRRYRSSLIVPPAPQARKATLTVSFPGWKHGTLADATFELAYLAETP